MSPEDKKDFIRHFSSIHESSELNMNNDQTKKRLTDNLTEEQKKALKLKERSIYMKY